MVHVILLTEFVQLRSDVVLYIFAYALRKRIHGRQIYQMVCALSAFVVVVLAVAVFVQLGTNLCFFAQLCPRLHYRLDACGRKCVRTLSALLLTGRDAHEHEDGHSQHPNLVHDFKCVNYGAEVSIYTPGPAGKIKGLQKHFPTQAKWGPTSHLHVKNVIGKE